MEQQISAPSLIGHDNTRARDQTCINVMRSWKKIDPMGVMSFIREVEETKAYMINPGGLSRGGTLMIYAVIPSRVDGVMTHIFGNNWQNDKKVSRSFYNACSMAKISSGRAQGEDRPTSMDGYQNEYVHERELVDRLIDIRKGPRG